MTKTTTTNNIFLIGPMGAGKTTIGQHLAKSLHLNFHDSDREIELRSGVNISWIFDVEGEAGFRQREQKVIAELTQMRDIVLATGGGCILNAQNRALLAANGLVIYLQVSIEQQLQRTLRNTHRPLLQTGNPQQALEKLYAERTPLYEEIADHTFITDGRSVRLVVNEIIRAIQQTS